MNTIVQPQLNVEEIIDPTLDPDDLPREHVNTKTCIWLKRRHKAANVDMPLRRSSKAYEIVFMLMHKRMTFKEIQDELYRVGVCDEEIYEKNGYRLRQAFYYVIRSGRRIAKIIGSDGVERYAIRSVTFDKITEIELLIKSDKNGDEDDK